MLDWKGQVEPGKARQTFHTDSAPIRTKAVGWMPPVAELSRVLICVCVQVTSESLVLFSEFLPENLTTLNLAPLSTMTPPLHFQFFL